MREMGISVREWILLLALLVTLFTLSFRIDGLRAENQRLRGITADADHERAECRAELAEEHRP